MPYPVNKSPMVALTVTRPMHTSFSPQFVHRDACHSTSHSGTTRPKDSWHTSRLSLGPALDIYPNTGIQGGLRTPPPEGRHHTLSIQHMKYAPGPSLRQFEPPVMNDSNVPRSLDSFRSSQHYAHQPQQILESPQPRRHSTINNAVISEQFSHTIYKAIQGPTSQGPVERATRPAKVKRKSMSGGITGMGISLPPIFNGQRISLPEFAAQVLFPTFRYVLRGPG